MLKRIVLAWCIIMGQWVSLAAMPQSMFFGLNYTAAVVGGPSLVQSCMENFSGTAVSCATSAAVPTGNCTAGETLIVFVHPGGIATVTMSGTGAGCPSSWTQVLMQLGQVFSDIDFYIFSGATQAGACTVTATKDGSAAGMAIEWVVASSGAVNGTPEILQLYTGPQTQSGPSTTTTLTNALVLGGVIEYGADTSFVINSPFGTTSPAQICQDMGAGGWGLRQGDCGSYTVTVGKWHRPGRGGVDSRAPLKIVLCTSLLHSFSVS